MHFGYCWGVFSILLCSSNPPFACWRCHEDQGFDPQSYHYCNNVNNFPGSIYQDIDSSTWFLAVDSCCGSHRLGGYPDTSSAMLASVCQRCMQRMHEVKPWNLSVLQVNRGRVQVLLRVSLELNKMTSRHSFIYCIPGLFVRCPACIGCTLLCLCIGMLA